MFYKKIAVFTLSLFILTGCDQSDNVVTKAMHNMALVQGGSFEMGDICLEKYGARCAFSNGNASLPVHKVTLDSFYMAKYKVTYQEYDAYTRAKNLPKLKIAENFLKQYPKLRGEDYPATANWQLSRDYCQWLANKTGLPIDLPTEAQWEYAARNRGQDVHYATSDGHFTQGVTVPTYVQREHYSGFTEGLYPVGQFPPTPLGLYDMAGNGQEWMRDWFSKDYYQHSPEHNPMGPAGGAEKVLRGMPSGDSARDDATPTASTMFRAGKEPLLKRVSLAALEKYDGDGIKAMAADPETDPYKVAVRGFIPKFTFRCVINASSLPDKYQQ